MKNELNKLIKEIESNENLKNLEVFNSDYWVLDQNGESVLYLDNSVFPDDYEIENQGNAWFYWFSLPGCLPDSEPFGPFDSEIDALKNVLEIYYL